METGILIAIIGGCATVLAAIVTGVFALLKKRGEKEGSGAIAIRNNKETAIIDTTLSGAVDVSDNRKLKIRGGKFNGKP